MSVVIDALTGAGPTASAVSSAILNREDTINGTTPVPVPSVNPSTNFTWIKSLQIEITVVGGLTMTNVRVGKVTSESVTGHKLWHNTTNAAYTQATGAPTATGDNNSTPPTLNGDVATAVPLISAPPAVYAAGPFNTTGRKGNIIEVVAGVDFTCVTTGTGVATPTLRWTWTEA